MEGVGSVRLVVDQPAWARVGGGEGQKALLESACAYRDQRAAYAAKRFAENPHNHAREDYADELARLRAGVKQTVLRQEDGTTYVPAGLADRVATVLGGQVDDRVSAEQFRQHHPPYQLIAPLAYTPRWYQTEGVRRLIEARHGAVEIAPGGGKTLMNLLLIQQLGLTATVVTPFRTIVQQTVREFERYLGARYVGQYGDGRKDLGKPVSVATAQALRLVKPGTPAWRHFAAKQVLSFDESHLAPAQTVQDLCYGLLAEAPYRVFWSGTQLRTDGLQLVLDGIVGPTVLTLDVKAAVREGALAPSAVRILEVRNPHATDVRDPGRATQEGLYRSKTVCRAVAELVDQMVELGRPVLVMVDELDQYARLAAFLQSESRFAHGCGDAARLKTACVPAEQRDPDVLDLVDRFNRGKFPVLVGTACVGTGVDVRATGAGFYLRGGRSEIDVRQTAGRFMRLFPGKRDVLIFDVDVVNAGVVHRHAEAREEVWRQLTNDVERVRWG